jgi:hypothetical protein
LSPGISFEPGVLDRTKIAEHHLERAWQRGRAAFKCNADREIEADWPLAAAMLSIAQLVDAGIANTDAAARISSAAALPFLCRTKTALNSPLWASSLPAAHALNQPRH